MIFKNASDSRLKTRPSLDIFHCTRLTFASVLTARTTHASGCVFGMVVVVVCGRPWDFTGCVYSEGLTNTTNQYPSPSTANTNHWSLTTNH